LLDAFADLADVLSRAWGNCTCWQAADKRGVWMTNRVNRNHLKLGDAGDDAHCTGT